MKCETFSNAKKKTCTPELCCCFHHLLPFFFFSACATDSELWTTIIYHVRCKNYEFKSKFQNTMQNKSEWRTCKLIFLLALSFAAWIVPSQTGAIIRLSIASRRSSHTFGMATNRSRAQPSPFEDYRRGGSVVSECQKSEHRRDREESEKLVWRRTLSDGFDTAGLLRSWPESRFVN